MSGQRLWRIQAGGHLHILHPTASEEAGDAAQGICRNGFPFNSSPPSFPARLEPTRKQNSILPPLPCAQREKSQKLRGWGEALIRLNCLKILSCDHFLLQKQRFHMTGCGDYRSQVLVRVHARVCACVGRYAHIIE